MEFIIRKAALDDIKRIQELHLMWFEKEDSEYGIHGNLNWTFSQDGENYFKSTIENQDKISCVVIIKDIIVGYLTGSVKEKNPGCTIDKKAELENIFVLEEFRSHGVGTALVEEFKKWCKIKNVEAIMVDTYASNVKGINFYEKSGFGKHEIILQMELK